MTHPPTGTDVAPRLRIRPARPTDLTDLHWIADRSVRTILAGRHYSDRQMTVATETRAYHVENALVDDGTYYVVEVNGLVVGGSGWSAGGAFHPPTVVVGRVERAESGPPVAVMRATYVDPAWARRGLATLLIRMTETAATLAGFRRFEALCTPASEGLRRAHGYRVVERVDLPITGDTSIVMARMRKDLPVERLVGDGAGARPGPGSAMPAAERQRS